jgi:hypothetical protein
MRRHRDHAAELLALLGEPAMIALAEAFGGTRLLIPTRLDANHAIAQVIGLDVARRLADRLAPDVINVPLSQELRARRYRSQGMSHAQIATRLGMTEGGVLRLLSRSGNGRKTSTDCASLPLFPDDRFR